MATVPQEQVTQRNNKATVTVTPGDEETLGHVQWLTTTVLPVTVTNTTAVAAAYDTPAEILAVMATYDTAMSAEQDLNADFGIGYPSIDQPLAVVGDGTEALAVANNETENLDISAFVVGGYQPLTYTLDDALVDTAGVTATQIGSVLSVTAGATDGTDTAVITVTDADDNEVEITVAITVA
jgi:hypothetical protein